MQVNYDDVKDMTNEEYFKGNAFAIDAFVKKYQTEEEKTYVQRIYKIAKEIASVEKTPELREYWTTRWFSEIFNDWWKPGGSIMQGAGLKNKNVSLANCFVRATEFITDSGVKTFKDFNDGDITKVLVNTGAFKQATIKNFGIQKITKLTLRRNNVIKEIETTLNHRWRVVTNKGIKIVPTADLKTGDKLPFTVKKLSQPPYLSPIGIIHGMVFGDGHYDTTTDSCILSLVGPEKIAFEKFFLGFNWIVESAGNSVKKISRLPKFMKQLPTLESQNIDYIRGFLAGLLAIDGTVDKNGVTSISSANKNTLVTISKLLEPAGIYISNILKKDVSLYNGNIDEKLYIAHILSSTLFSELFLKESHLNNYTNYIKNKAKDRSKVNWTVSEITDVNKEEEVWCAQVPEIENFTLSGGVNTCNCNTLSLGVEDPGVEWDSLEGIIRNTAYSVAKSAAYRQGLGVDFSRIRPRDSAVNNAAKKSTGSIHWMEFIDSIGKFVGQCLVKGTPILTTRGYKAIENIVIGDEVYGINGKTKVVDTFSNGKKQIFKLTTQYGDTIEASDEHKVKIVSKTGELISTKLKDVKIGDFIVAPIIKNYEGITLQIPKFKYDLDTHDSNNRLVIPTKLPIEINEDLAYLGGIIFGDYYMQKSTELSLSLANLDIKQKVDNILFNLFGVHIGDYGFNLRPGDGAVEIVTLNQYVTAFLKHAGLAKQKAGDLVFPEVLKQATLPILKSFLAGLFDANEHNSSIRSNIGLSLVAGDFLIELKREFFKFGIILKVSQKTSNPKVYKLSIIGKNSADELINLQSNSIKLCQTNSLTRDQLKTPYKSSNLGIAINKLVPKDINATEYLSSVKYKKYSKQESNYYIQKVTNIEALNIEKDTYDIMVDDKDHFFTIPGMFVSNSGRIPAFLFSLSINHPDVEEFIQVKKDYTRVQNANISVQVTNAFYNAVKAGLPWELQFTIPEVKKGQKVYIDKYTAVNQDLKDEKGYYYVATKDVKGETISKIVDARKLFSLIAKNMWKNAEPGIQNIDIARAYSNSDAVYNEKDPYNSRILSTNAPLVAGTLVPTKDGIFKIEDLFKKGSAELVLDSRILPQPLSKIKPKPKYIASFKSCGIPVSGTFKRYNNQDIYNIQLKGGPKLRCNGEHAWFTNRGFVPTNKLLKTDKFVIPTNGIVQTYNKTPDFTTKDFKDGQLIGYIVGDGFIFKKEASRNMVGIKYLEKDKYFADLFINKYKEITGRIGLTPRKRENSLFELKTVSTKFKQYIESFGVTNDKYRTPEKSFTSIDFASGFLSGLFQSDGHVRLLNNTSSKNVSLTSVNKDLILNVQQLLLNWFGIVSRYEISTNRGVKYTLANGTEKISNARDRLNLVIGISSSLIKFHEYIPLYNDKLSRLKLLVEHQKNIRSVNEVFFKIESITKTAEKADMYCAVVDGVHSFIAQGVLSHNCSEQYLSRDSVCILASLIMSTFSADPDAYKKELDIIAPSVNRFLDNVNTYELERQTYFSPMQKMAIEKLRRVGAGFTDLGGWLFKNNMEYGTDAANAASEEFQKYYNYQLYKSSIALGEEKGSYGLFNKERLMKSLFIQNMSKEFPDLKFNSMRNVTLSTIAPSGTLSLMCRTSLVSYGVEASFGLYYWKRTRISGEYKYYFTVPTLIRKAFESQGIKLPISSDIVEDTWDGAIGTKVAKIIEDNKEKIGLHFREASEVSPVSKMHLMGKLMKWVDSSISVTYLLNENSTAQETEDFIMLGYDLGVKSISAFPDKKMYGIVSRIPFKTLATNLMADGIQIHPQNFSKKEQNDLLLDESRIVFTSAPKRPKKLKADVFQVHVKGEKYLIIVGLLNGVPYEIFGGKSKDLNFTFRDKKGTLEKVKRNHYKLVISMSDTTNDTIEIENLGHYFTDEEQDRFRMLSISLRHGTPIKFIVDQLTKSTNDMFSIAAATSRVLKKYIKDGEIAHGKACPNCGSIELTYADGCVSCSCGWSKCD